MQIKSKFLAISLCALLTLSAMSGCQDAAPESDNPSTAAPAQTTDGNPVIDGILGSYSSNEFKKGEVSDEDLQLILQSGARAASARNEQPWHFTVVTGKKAGELLSQAKDGNVLIVVSGLDEAEEGMPVEFDCGAATAYLYLAAQSLGYGAHIYMGGVAEINEKQRDALELPDGYSARMLLLIGEAPDAVSSASLRKDLSETVTYIS